MAMSNSLIYHYMTTLTACKRFTVVASKGQYYKIFLICNVRTLNKYHNKLVYLLLSVTSTGLDKHISLLRNQYIKNLFCFIVYYKQSYKQILEQIYSPFW